MLEKKRSNNLTRRSFVAATSAAAAFTIVPRHVLGGAGYISPSEKLNIAGVGVGGKGGVDIKNVSSENIVALCDVDFRKAGRTFKAYPRAKRYKDFRVMLDKQKDIDAVMVATPDHTHAVISMEAIRRGKHVYTQKPLTHTIHEAQVLAEAARKHKVATQMGNQGQADDGPRRLREMIWDGAIGPVRHVHTWTDRPNRGLLGVYWPQGVGRPKDTSPVPDTLDWDLWLGPAPARPYNRAYHPFSWRGWWDFGTGALGDIGCHRLDPIFRALKLGYPTSVQAESTLVNRETYPSGSIVTYEFPARGDMPPVKVTWYDGGLRPERPAELPDGAQLGANGVIYVGDKGKIFNNMIFPDSLRQQYKTPPASIVSSPGHYKEWLNACKGGKPAGSNFDWAGPLTETVLMGNVALRMELRSKLDRQKLLWDAKAKRFSNLQGANEFLHKTYRKGWTL
ncbi:MAG: Gfo/Idh/MocA family oxidoreductase [Planctomycetes bacterium]|nr:Gfo/Idh/MocA family oxidoreductase [Planctomycetota bacterium]